MIEPRLQLAAAWLRVAALLLLGQVGLLSADSQQAVTPPASGSSPASGSPPPARPLDIPVPARKVSETPANDLAGLATLHVYTNLEQIPVLVLSPLHERMKPVDEAKFRVRLDSGPAFKPIHVRREGDDPLSLAILIDVTRPKNELLPGIEDAVARLANGPLTARDHVSIYVMDCSLIRSAYDLPAGDPGKLRRAIKTALDPWHERLSDPPRPPCRIALPLWDTMASITRQLWQQPGRRVLLAVTDGQDGDGKGTRSLTQWSEVVKLTQATSTAVIGLKASPIILIGENVRPPGLRVDEDRRRGAEDPFSIICEVSGGVELGATRKSLERQLERVVSMLRERYIVEIRRGNQDTPGRHNIEVSILKTDAYIRAAGITVPLAGQQELANPLTLPEDPARLSPMGDRRILAAPAVPAAPANPAAPAAPAATQAAPANPPIAVPAPASPH